MSQWAFVGSVTTTGGGIGTNLSITKPAAAAAGRLAIIPVYWEPDTNTVTISGFTSALRFVNTGLFMVELFYRILDGSEGASFTAVPSIGTQWRAGGCAIYQNGTGSGPWVDVTASQQADGALEPQLATSVTTTGVDRLIIAFGGFFTADSTSASGAAPNFRFGSGGIALADGTKATAGATGTTGFSGGGTQDYAAGQVAFISDSGGGGGGNRRRRVLIG